MPNIFGAFQSEVKNLFGVDLAQLMVRLRDFWPHYIQITDESQKIAAMLDFLASFINKLP